MKDFASESNRTFLKGHKMSIQLSNEFIEKYVRFSNPQYIQVYLYLKYRFDTDGEIPSSEAVSGELSIPADRVNFILGYWLSEGKLERSGDGSLVFTESDTEKKHSRPKLRKRSDPKMRPSYKSSEIEAAAEKNQVLSGMFYQAESILGHLLSGNDMELLYSFYDWLGLPCEVIVMLLSYAAGQGKTGKRYLETVAMDWSDRGIDTFDKAEEYISELEEINSSEHKIRSILGIYDRALTQTEKKYIGSWTRELKIAPELVEAAYDRTVENTGKLSWAYMNKILVSWHENGIKDKSGVERENEIFEQTKKSRSYKPKSEKSKFNNYEDTNKTDYASLEEELLNKMLDS